MKYLMIDTNIYIDMIVSRNQDHKAESYNHLMKLLDYGEIRLIVPKIVMTEVFRHLDNEIDKVGEGIKAIKDKTNNLYWINHVEELEKFNDNLRPVKKGINDLNDEFKYNKEKYKAESRELFSKLFNHNNAITIDETEDIIFKATQRKVHKMRPFHYSGKGKDKDSMADSIIIESLINIEDCMVFGSNDEIYFISRNPSDFSADEDNDLLHNDIKLNLDTKGLSDRVYYRLRFTSTLLKDFKDETERADLIEELEVQAEYEEQIAIEENYYWQDEMNREVVGLTSLSADYETIISELDQIVDLMYMVEEIQREINEEYEKYLDTYYSLDDELNKKSIKELQSLANIYNSKDPLLKLSIDGYTDECDIKGEIWWLVDFLCFKEDEFDFENMVYYQEFFGLNTTLATISDIQGNKYRLDTSGELTPANDEENTINIDLYRNDTLIKRGKVKIYYGYMNFDDEGNASDGAEESIYIDIKNVLNEITNLKNGIINEIDYKRNVLIRIMEKLGI